MFKKDNKNVIFFNSNLLGKLSFIFYIGKKIARNCLIYNLIGCKR